MISLYLLLPLLGASLAHNLGYSHSHSPIYMVGKEFFKQESNRPNLDLEEDHHEQMPYDVVEDYGNYELRDYPSVSLVCTGYKEDQAADPFANMENANPWRIMMSRRYQKTPSSIMFKRLFRYISGVNQEGKEIEMTTPVTLFGKVVREDDLGDIVKKVMCFYLPSEYQPGHTHKYVTGVRIQPAPRHDALPPPQPMEDSQVFLYTRPEMKVYVRRFGGWAMTAETWIREIGILRSELIGKQVKDDEFFTSSYDSPMKMENRRNEVWIQSTKDGAADMSTVLDHVDWE